MTLPPSRFGVGYTVGGGPASPVSPSGAAVPAGTAPSAPAPAMAAAAPDPAAAMNTLAVVSFVSVLLLGPLAVIASIPMAVAARAQINRRGQSGSGLVIATLALSVVYLAFGVVVLLLLLYAQNSVVAAR